MNMEKERLILEYTETESALRDANKRVIERMDEGRYEEALHSVTSVEGYTRQLRAVVEQLANLARLH